MVSRPVIYVLAGVNGAGKSSIGGHMLDQAGKDWYNPDQFALAYSQLTGAPMDRSNAVAWTQGVEMLTEALRRGTDFAFETTLGGRTIPAMLAKATKTHDVVIWFVGLNSAEKHLQRVASRVAAGGHDIPEQKIRERYVNSLKNLIDLLPAVRTVVVYDNSADANSENTVPDPLRVLIMEDNRVTYPVKPIEFVRTPDWAKPIVEAAMVVTKII